jgi:hypothetical protein
MLNSSVSRENGSSNRTETGSNGPSPPFNGGSDFGGWGGGGFGSSRALCAAAAAAPPSSVENEEVILLDVSGMIHGIRFAATLLPAVQSARHCQHSLR